MTVRHFTPLGLLALEPRAFGMLLAAEPFKPYCEERDGVCVLGIRGPLLHHDDPFCDSYDAIKRRVASALGSSCRAVVLAIDSPGGLVSGCFDTAAELRALAAVAGKPLIAFVDGQATSAAYALACACSAIYASDSAMVGSIGVIDTVLDLTAQDVAAGMRMALVTSGARKADGNPHAPIDEARVAAAQRNVDAIAGMFFELVAGARGIAADAVRGFEAGTYPGAVAKGFGLVDDVVTFDALIAMVAAGQITTALEGSRGETMSAKSSDYESTRAALEKMAEGDDANARAAKRALAAFTAEGDDEKKDDDEKPESKAEGDDEKKDDDEKKEAKAEGDEKKPEAKASGAPGTHAAAASAGPVGIDAGEIVQRAALLASRPDLSDDVRAELASLPLPAAKKLIAAMPKAVSPARAAIAGATAEVKPTTGGTPQGGIAGVSYHSPHAAELDRRMGLSKDGQGVRVEGDKLILSAASGAKNEAK